MYVCMYYVCIYIRNVYIIAGELHTHTHTHYYTKRLPSHPRRSRPCASLLHTTLFTTHRDYPAIIRVGVVHLESLGHVHGRQVQCPVRWHRLIYTHIHIFISMYICMYIYACIRMYIHICMYTYIHTHIRTYTHTYVYTYIHTYIHTPPCARARTTSKNVITFKLYVLL
jgi:hypothetical protein